MDDIPRQLSSKGRSAWSPTHLAAVEWPGERATLLALFEAARGANWTRSDNWTHANVSVCAWWGIECNPDGHVTNIGLGSNGLSNSLSQLDALSFLIDADFSANSLVEILPQSMPSSLVTL